MYCDEIIDELNDRCSCLDVNDEFYEELFVRGTIADLTDT